MGRIFARKTSDAQRKTSENCNFFRYAIQDIFFKFPLDRKRTFNGFPLNLQVVYGDLKPENILMDPKACSPP